MDNIEYDIDGTIDDLIDAMSEAFGIELTPEDRTEVVSNTKTIVAAMEASRPENTKKSKSKN